MSETAKRDDISVRYDLLDPIFLKALARIAHYGAQKYGERNWQLSRLTGNKSPMNHVLKHMISYESNEPYDHIELGTNRYMHLAAIAFNAMMEFFHEYKEAHKNETVKTSEIDGEGRGIASFDGVPEPPQVDKIPHRNRPNPR